ncbi:MAG TPA: BBE domain-containing protein, partial [Agriterribacter sp.]|nr:BBE domain-containing protein [Agriterribacter sp.]
VVSFTFKLSPVHTVYAGPMLWELDDTEEMMTWHHELISKAPNELSGYFALLTVPPAAPFPEHLHLKKMCGVIWCYTGDMEKAEEVFKPVRAKKAPSLDFVGPMPVPTLQTLFDALYPPGLLWYWKADYVKDLSAEAIKLHVEYGKKLPTPFSTMHLYNINGAASKPGNDETAWNYRDANYAMVIVGITNDVNEKEKVISWARDYWSAMHPYSMGGAYVNFLMDEGADRVKASYGDNYKKLTEVKAKYDPGNLFRVNQNIKPAVA